jgi:hypothetical protein
MVHLHYVLWKRGAPRFDLRAEVLEAEAKALSKAGVLSDGRQKCKIDDVVDFFSQYVSEWNPNKDASGTTTACRVAEQVNKETPHPASLSAEAMLALLQDDAHAQRREYYEHLVRTEQTHDWHYPDPLGPPNPTQPCAKLMKGTTNMWYCSSGIPKDLV